MLILFDECTPWQLRKHLADHTVKSVRQLGWQGKQNGELLALIRLEGIDLLLTVDQNMPYQQNLRTAGTAVMVLIAPSNNVEDLEPLVPAIHKYLAVIQPGDLVEIATPEDEP